MTRSLEAKGYVTSVLPQSGEPSVFYGSIKPLHGDAKEPLPSHGQLRPQTPQVSPPPPVSQEPSFQPKTDFGDHLQKTSQDIPIQKALRQLDESYATLKQAINLKKFNPDKIETYLQRAEKQFGMILTDTEKQQLRVWASSGNEEWCRLVALELRVGIPEKAEKEALSALGRLMLYREETQALHAYLLNTEKDPNLKAYVQMLLMTNRVEKALARYERMKQKIRRALRPFQWIVLPIKGQSQHNQKNKQ